MYLKDDSYIREYSNNAPIADINPSDNFGLDDYEPEFFLDPLTWNSADFSLALKFDVDDFTNDIFYFCHVSFREWRMQALICRLSSIFYESMIPHLYSLPSFDAVDSSVHDWKNEICGRARRCPQRKGRTSNSIQLRYSKRV